MRAPEPRRTISNADRVVTLATRAAWISALGVLALASTACPDSLHINPEQTSTSGTAGTGGHGTGGTGGTGGAAPVACESNTDCTYPTPVCDTVKHECFGCLETADCIGQPGTVCSKGACVCPTATDTYCPALGNQSPRCVDTSKTPADCGACGHACFGSCTAGTCADKWEPTSTVGAPAPRARHVAVWTGSQMIVWGGAVAGGVTNSGGIYDPATGTWTPTSLVNAPSPRQDATAVWDDTDKQMIVWGGYNGGPLGTGAAFDPAKNVWTSVATIGAPLERYQHTAVWATSKKAMIVWGGTGPSGELSDGAIYTPSAQTWSGVTTTGSPSARREHAAIWDDVNGRMLVWGGYGPDPNNVNPPGYLNDGQIYDFGTMSWFGLDNVIAPSARARHTAVWDGMQMIVWGGFDGSTPYFNDGGRSSSGSWFPIPADSPTLPEPREGHSAVWIDSAKQMIVFGGNNQNGVLSTGYALDITYKWNPLPTAPAGRTRHTAVVAGSKMIIWGGDTGGSNYTNTGAIYDTAP